MDSQTPTTPQPSSSEPLPSTAEQQPPQPPFTSEQQQPLPLPSSQASTSHPPNPEPAADPQPHPQAQTLVPAMAQQPRPPALGLGRGGPHFSHSTSLASQPAAARGMAIGVPAHQPPRPFTTYQPFNSPTPSPQVRPTVQGMQTIGMLGSLSSASMMHPTGLPGQHQQRPGQPTLRSTSPSTSQNLNSQKFQGHGLARGSSLALPDNPSPGPQSTHPGQHQWMSTQAKQTHGAPSPSSYRPQARPLGMQQRPHTPQQTISYPQQISSSQQQQQHHKQQQLQQQKQQQVSQQTQQQQKTQNSQSGQQQAVRGLVLANQKPNVQESVGLGVQPGVFNAPAGFDAAEIGDHILSKRSIRELVSQIDPSEKLDAEVEDVLMEIADDFIESVTTFACSLAKHRKSSVLEAKDILLHVERNWNMTLPGFGGDEIKSYKKPFTNEIHRERLAVIKKSMAGGGDGGGAKVPAVGQSAGGTKSQLKPLTIASPYT